MKNVTIQDIAKELNLSRNTVSKVLNGKDVPDKTKKIVLEKVRQLNYKSFNNNFNIINRKYRLLLVSAKPLYNMNYFISLISSIENYCYKNQYDLFQYTINKKDSFEKFKHYVEELNIDGIVAIEFFDKQLIMNLLELNIPICFHDFAHTSQIFPKSYDIICTNDEQSIYSIVKQLKNTYNLSSFSFVGDTRHCRSFRKRYTGMLLGLMNLKIKHDNHEDITLSEERFDYANPETLKSEISKLKKMPEVFICCNDFVARNVCIALKGLDLNVPSDVIVIGFDNATESYSLLPTLTTFAIDKNHLGLQIMQTLINRIENKDMPSRDITLSTNLIVRESSSK